MKAEIDEFVRISKRLGRDPSLVLGSFGNTSVKTTDGRYMLIKASGTRLKDMTAENGWRTVQTQKVLDILSDESLKALDPAAGARLNNALLDTCCDDKPTGLQPSIESFFHAILDRCVVHLHPDCVLAVACAQDGPHYLKALFAHKHNKPLWIPYVGLGFTCAKEILHHINAYRREHGHAPTTLVIQNHGLIISEKDTRAAKKRVEKTIKIFDKVMIPLKARCIEKTDPQELLRVSHMLRSAIFEATDQRINTAHFNNETITAFMNLPEAEALCQGGPITNDEAALTHGPAVLLPEATPQAMAQAIHARLAAGHKTPGAYLIKPFGLFIAMPDNHLTNAAQVAQAYMKIRAAAATMGGARPIPKTLLDQYAEPTGQ